jgi:hypothetical protein
VPLGKDRQQPIERLGSATRRIGTLEHFQWLERIVAAILVLNIIDAIFTIYWVSSRQAREANPFMAPLIEAHPVLFVGIKCGLVFGGTWLLWRNRKRKLAVVSIFTAFLVYYFVLLYHLNAAQLHIFRRIL